MVENPFIGFNFMKMLQDYTYGCYGAHVGIEISPKQRVITLWAQREKGYPSADWQAHQFGLAEQQAIIMARRIARRSHGRIEFIRTDLEVPFTRSH
jgi:hypothetical protein